MTSRKASNSAVGDVGPRAPRCPATELPQLCERFFITASPAELAELRAFLIAEGVHPATALGWFTDSLGFATYHPGPGE
jgi:hypothetical protein